MTDRVTVRGNIYIVDSPLSLALKIGKSKRDERKIASRYSTSYGSCMTIYIFESDDIDSHERQVHRLLDEYNICLELFEKKSLREAINACETICHCKSTIYEHYGARRANMEINYATLAPRKNIQISINYIYTGEIAAELRGVYDDDIVKKIYTDLSSILRYKTWQESLAYIYDITNSSTGYPSHEYLRHKYAMLLITSCGFSDIEDKSVVSRETLVKSLADNEEAIKKAADGIYFAFGGKKHMRTGASVHAALQFINYKLEPMYGMKICAVSGNNKDRNSFVIRHNYLGTVFPSERPRIGLLKPLLMRGHMQNPIIITNE